MGLFSAIAAVGSVILGNKARKADKNASKDRARINQITNTQRRRQLVKDFRRARATALTQGVGQGGEVGSSGIQGVRTSLRSQAGTALFENFVQERLDQSAQENQFKADRLRFFGNVLNQVGNIAQGIQDTRPVTGSTRTAPTVSQPITQSEGSFRTFADESVPSTSGIDISAFNK